MDARAVHSSEPTAADWPESADALGNPEFLAIVQVCVDQLPERLSRVLLMRDRLARTPAAISRELGLSRSECDELLFRARTQLRARVEARWLAARSRT